jgi:hypothetical protein
MFRTAGSLTRKVSSLPTQHSALANCNVVFPASPPGRCSTIGGPSREITSGPPVLGMISTFPLWSSDTECFPQNSTITTSTAERIRLAGAAIDVAIDKLDADGQFDCTATLATIRRPFIFSFSKPRHMESRGTCTLKSRSSILLPIRQNIWTNSSSSFCSRRG